MIKKRNFACYILLSLTSPLSVAAPKHFENLYPRVCKEGLHKQPHGQFGIYAFCDEVHGTNIAVMHIHPGDSKLIKWPISKRFWQGEKWANDVSSIGWVPNQNHLVVTTSGIYSEGFIYLLDLENQKSEIIMHRKNCGSEILAINQKTVTVRVDDCENEKLSKKMVLELPRESFGQSNITAQ